MTTYVEGLTKEIAVIEEEIKEIEKEIKYYNT